MRIISKSRKSYPTTDHFLNTKPSDLFKGIKRKLNNMTQAKPSILIDTFISMYKPKIEYVTCKFPNDRFIANFFASARRHGYINSEPPHQIGMKRDSATFAPSKINKLTMPILHDLNNFVARFERRHHIKTHCDITLKIEKKITKRSTFVLHTKHPLHYVEFNQSVKQAVKYFRVSYAQYVKNAKKEDLL